MKKVESVDCWILPSPRLASDVVGLVVGSGWGQVWTLNEELICLRVVGLVLEPREGEAGADGLLTAGDGRQAQALTLCPDEHHPIVAREIPGLTEPRRDWDEGSGWNDIF